MTAETEVRSLICFCGLIEDGYPSACGNFEDRDDGYCLHCEHKEECHADKR